MRSGVGGSAGTTYAVAMRSYAHDRLVFEVKDEGPEDGQPVVFLHGFPQDSTSWDAVVEPLHERGYRTLAPNQRGYSPSARPRGARNYRWASLAGDVVALLDAAGVDTAHVVGHDWGGAVAWCLASEHSDRVRTVTSLSTPHPGALRSASLRKKRCLTGTRIFRLTGRRSRTLGQTPSASALARERCWNSWSASRSCCPAAESQ